MSNKRFSVVPKLRFPKFSGAPGWDAKRLGELFRDRQESGVAGLPLLSLMDKEGIVPQESSNRKNNSNSDKSKYLRVVPGDIAYNTMRMWEGRSAYVGLEGLVSPAYTVCEPTSGVNSVFFSYYFKTSQLIEQFRRYSQGLVKDTLNLKYEAFAKIFTAIPSEFEQEKIADCLSSLDELIAAQARKVDALKTYKKGLMQQLFPREGETQPRLRFPEFRDAGAWSKRKLSDFLTERSQFPENKVPLYSLTIEDGVTPKTERYERAFLVNDEAEAYKLVLPNDFAFNPMNLRFGAIGRHSGTEAVAVSKYYNIFYCDESVDSRFCEVYFRSDEMVRFYDTMAIGSLIEKRRVHFSDFLKFNIRFPSSLEQLRIADCLTSLDTLITAATKKLETLKTHKKGLMQQLFPLVEAAA